MAEWRTPVFDRTREDVEHAIKTIADWVNSDVSVNPLAVHDLKGCLNVSDINRIEGNIAYLAEMLNDYCYSPDFSTKSWTNSGLPNETDISRILNNLRAIIGNFYQQSEAPPVPHHLQGYEDVNSVEENLFLIKELLDCMVASFKKSSTFKSGGSRLLPIRR